MFTRIRASGMWVPRSGVGPAEFEVFDRDRARAVDGTGGGAYAPTTLIEIGGKGMTVAGPFSAGDVQTMTWGGTSLPQLASRSYPYVQPMAPLYNEGSGTFVHAGVGAQHWTLPNDTDYIWFPVANIPKNGTVTAITAYIHPQGPHGGLPAVMPRFEAFSRPVSTGVSVSLGVATDPAASTGAYEIYHSFGLTGLSTVNDGTREIFLRFRPENGVDSLTGLRLFTITATVTVTELAPG